MTPDVVVDIGNSRMKWGLCRDGRVSRMAALQSLNPDAWTAKAERWGLAHGTRWVVTSVNPKPVLPFFEWAKARGDTLRGIAGHEEIGLPVAVEQPERVGSDRLFNALAAVRRAPVGTPVVAVSVGTAMTIDFVSADGVFLGGQILPGPRTMARSLRDYTAALPLVEAEPTLMSDYCGKNTTDAINVGINSAVTGAVFNAVWSFCDDAMKPAWAFVTGGDARYLSADNFPDGVTELVFDSRLTLEGIRIAAEALPVTPTRVAVLTPPGTGAIATVEVAGDRGWEFARKLFRPAGKPLPETPEVNRFWFGKLGDGAGDEVILAATGDGILEVHCHGGRRVVRWVVEQFVALGCVEVVASGGREPPDSSPDTIRGLTPPARLLPYAPTLRTAGILLDQLHGAFDGAVQVVLHFLANTPGAAPAYLRQLARFAPIGRHLVEPWKVVVAGAPNVGKSSLVNALAGYQRAVVSEVAGTTRDAVSVHLALDGWPVELTDTAGLRDAEGLEAEGIERARRALAEADLVVWMIDATAPVADAPGSPGGLVVWNKSDLATPPSGLAVSAKTGAGIPALVSEIVARLIPHPPAPGVAVPYTPQLADAVEAANAALASGNVAEATRLLRDCLASR